MLLSMTGYGRKVLQEEDSTVTVEVRALNNKYLDLSIRMPPEYRHKEMDVRKTLQSRLIRGKVDVSVTVENAAGEEDHVVNPEAVRYYCREVGDLAASLGLEPRDLLHTIMGLPNATVPRPQDDPESSWTRIDEALRASCGQLDEFRQREGEALDADLRERAGAIETLRREIAETEPARTARIRERLRRQIDELRNPEVDENRFEQELIYYLEKNDINEELVRLASHLGYFLEHLGGEGPEKGKKLGFIAQEMGREINTIGSKANDAGIQQLVVQMKDELEKIKEQSLNVL